jgi:crossover junction endodeoxyribonuclease RuvC
VIIKILGIDPGTIRCGYAIIEKERNRLKLIDAGIIKMKEKVLKYQILELIEGLEIIFENNNIDEVAIEDIFFAHNPKGILKLAQFRGALTLRILQKCGNFSEYTPLQVKKAVTGNGKADKESVAFMVKRILGLKGEIKPFDITDAMAITICHSQRI